MIRSAEEFVRLRSSENREEYRRAAHEPAAVATWLGVIKRFPEFRAWVAHNKTVPMEVLEVLAQDVDPRVRRMVAMKNKLTPALLERLAQDADESVRHRVAYNRHTPLAVLEALLEDSSEMVRVQAAARLRNG